MYVRNGKWVGCLGAAEERQRAASYSRPFYMQHVGAFMHEVGKQLQDLQITRGGNIIMVQVENEYGSYGTDKPYVSAIRDTVRAAGFTEVPLFQCDWSSIS